MDNLQKAWNLVDPAQYYKRLNRTNSGDPMLASLAKKATSDKWIFACIPDAELRGLGKSHFIEACALKGRAVKVYRNRSKPGLVISEIGMDEPNTPYYGPILKR
jgi:hypothetical protein